MTENTEDFEEFEDEDLDIEDSAESLIPATPAPKKVEAKVEAKAAPVPVKEQKKGGRPPKVQAVPVQEPMQVEAPVQQIEPQYVAVPRVVSMETMLNEIYDSQQEIRQALIAVLNKLNEK